MSVLLEAGTAIPSKPNIGGYGPGVRRDDEKGVYYLSFHSLVRLAISAVTASRIADGVREKRGAGAGWVTPWRLTKIFRAAMCGCSGASLMVRTGAKQTSVPSMILHHSSRVFVLNTSTSLCLSEGHALRSICASNSAPESPACWRSKA